MMRSAILATLLIVAGVLPVAARQPPAQQAVRVGGDVKPPQQIKNVLPEYPQAAIAARVEER